MRRELTKVKAGITVAIPCFNAETVLPRTLQSLLAKNLTPDEILVVDDGSTDRSIEVAESFGSAVRVLHQENYGAAAARHTGVRNAAFDIIVFIDSGDVATPIKISSYITALRAMPDTVCAYGVARNRARPRPSLSPVTGLPLDGSMTRIEKPFELMLRHFWPLIPVMDLAIRRDVAIESTRLDRFFRVTNDYSAQIMTVKFGDFVHVAALTGQFDLLEGGLWKTHGLPLQIAYALCGAVAAYEHNNDDPHAALFLVRQRVDEDFGTSVVTAYVRRDRALLMRLLQLATRHTSHRKVPRRGWWALKNAHLSGNLHYGRPLTGLLAVSSAAYQR